jgi:hypothetical protein
MTLVPPSPQSRTAAKPPLSHGENADETVEDLRPQEADDERPFRRRGLRWDE